MSNTSHSSQSLEFPILMIYSVARSNIWKRNSTFGKTKGNLFKWLCILFCELWMQCTVITNGHNLDCYEQTNSLNLINSYVAISWTSIFSPCVSVNCKYSFQLFNKEQQQTERVQHFLVQFCLFPITISCYYFILSKPKFQWFQ